MAGENGAQLQNYFTATDEPLVISGDSTNYNTTTNITWATPHMSGDVQIYTDKHGIHPRLYFTFIKRNLSTLESRFLKRRMKQLEKMVDKFAALGQEAMSEECIRQFCTISRESAMLACGIKKFITQEHAEKFRHKIRGKPLMITPIKNFARPIPKAVTKKIKKCMDKKLFDSYVIFHLDEKAERDTEADKERKRKERERDPIVFGCIEYSDKYYFIADWEDEFDDLRLSDIIKKLSLKKKDITMKQKIEFKLKEKTRKET